MQNNTLSIPGLILNADIFVQIIMLLLIVASAVSWTLIFSKKSDIVKKSRQLKKFSKGFNPKAQLDGTFNPNDVNPIASTFKEARAEYQRGQEYKSERAGKILSLRIESETNALEKGLSTLAIIGSASPYIGLLGTVWGIMHSFLGLASVKQATIAIVAPGIAEALIATAFGLFAAIPASIFYNKLTTEVDQIYSEYQRLASEYITIMNR